MSDKNDFGFYGKGLDGYVHYKQSFDRINDGPNNSEKPKCYKNETSNKKALYFFNKQLTWWQVILLLVLIYGTIFIIVQLRLD